MFRPVKQKQVVCTASWETANLVKGETYTQVGWPFFENGEDCILLLVDGELQTVPQIFFY